MRKCSRLAYTASAEDLACTVVRPVKKTTNPKLYSKQTVTQTEHPGDSRASPSPGEKVCKHGAHQNSQGVPCNCWSHTYFTRKPLHVSTPFLERARSQHCASLLLLLPRPTLPCDHSLGTPRGAFLDFLSPFARGGLINSEAFTVVSTEPHDPRASTLTRTLENIPDLDQNVCELQSPESSRFLVFSRRALPVLREAKAVRGAQANPCPHGRCCQGETETERKRYPSSVRQPHITLDLEEFSGRVGWRGHRLTRLPQDSHLWLPSISGPAQGGGVPPRTPGFLLIGSHPPSFPSYFQNATSLAHCPAFSKAEPRLQPQFSWVPDSPIPDSPPPFLQFMPHPVTIF
ncbi:hypothetical protein H920_10487 [Fukomys damarensis]|uniref:Uncharacterized protein n=1 Tax=Fukomys damarensis TaxID=885580 RepID=A0A091DC90_FUKDA|nr:hypothetical protein H920_10487 [Fukomys damarensis]